jgi:hypothetical protein
MNDNNRFTNALLFVFLGLALSMLLGNAGIYPFAVPPTVVTQPCPCGPSCPCLTPNTPHAPHNPYGPRRGSTGQQGSLGAVDANGKTNPAK